MTGLRIESQTLGLPYICMEVPRFDFIYIRNGKYCIASFGDNNSCGLKHEDRGNYAHGLHKTVLDHLNRLSNCYTMCQILTT